MKYALQLLYCFILGCLASQAMAPVGFVPALVLGLSFLYFFCADATPVRCFLLGWLFAFGYFVVGLYWVGNALLVEGNPYRWAWPLAVAGLPFILSFFQAFACFFARYYFDLKKMSGFIAFVILSAFYEWARGHAFTGFPWNLYGHAWTRSLAVMQILSLINVYGLTLLTIFWCTAPGFLVLANIKTPKGKSLALIALLSFVFCLSYGHWRLQSSDVSVHPDINIRLVQANIPEAEKWKREKLWKNFLRHVELSNPGPDDAAGKTTLVVWSETALNRWVLQEPDAMALITSMLHAYPGPAYLLTGMLRYEPDTQRYYNSLVMIDAAGEIRNVYDKNHLVPFGEYIPLQKWIPFEPVARFKGFAGGSGPVTYRVNDTLKYSPAICYEIIFPGRVANRHNPPDVIINVTNDSWYGESSGPWQHLYQAVFRAIEEGIPVIRVADTGFSAIINSRGQIIEKSGLFAEYEKTVALSSTK